MARFSFLVYRLNIVDLLETDGKIPLRGREDILRLLKTCAKGKYDVFQKTKKSTYVWSVRDMVFYSEGEVSKNEIVWFTLHKSLVEKEGVIVTNESKEEGVSHSDPPTSDGINVVIDMYRHLVAVEKNSKVVSMSFSKQFSNITQKAAYDIGFSSCIVLEAKPSEADIYGEYLAFEKVTRMRVSLRLPNPEWSRITKWLYDLLKNGGVREYVQDMKNEQEGLSGGKEELPFATVAMAQQGYKNGPVRIEGYKSGKREVLETGRDAEVCTLEIDRALMLDMLKSDDQRQQNGVRLIAERMEDVDIESSR